ncbi:hypothetical protein FHT40_002412 [Mycolicibacterium sp. BK556]|uniref:hypothetical protein n=1 Tax=unclassified Mycolicibacterium TaxID=2636767 RepID=UPI001609D12F|nr:MULTISPECIES: hypothetical protein [unclassified Mycolicibacterium]MBB3602751.1 hypothetical protein [Mycolicibacterium sp. BK556]MBB3632944.1 hypothetical protein [Mycolicibacterium sp. BK607]
MAHEHPGASEPAWPIDLVEGLRERLTHASDTDSLITAADARTIASCLSDHLDAALTTALSRYAATGHINAPAVRAECLAARASGMLMPALGRWSAWLIIYAAHALPPEAGEQMIPANGDALDAFLDLPDIDPASSSVLDHFVLTYCGSYPDADAVLDGITDIQDWQRELARTTDKLGIGEFVAIDREAILARILEGWDIIPRHGRLHVFAR